MNNLAVITLCLVALCPVVFAEKSSTTQASPDRAAWLRTARFGVMSHYLSDLIERNEPSVPPMTPERWNDAIDHFDVDALAGQLHEAGADYYLLTIGQNSGYFLAPNPTYDRLAQSSVSHCSRRDLISDLAKALEKQHIRLMVYLPAGAPDRDADACKALQWQSGPHRNAEFQAKWELIIADWSKRFGTKVSGWWFDGCYWPDAMYRSNDAPHFASFAAAARVGNPDSIVCFNPGVLPGELQPITPAEDYTAGEANDPNVHSAHPDATGRVNGATPHVLTFLGAQWATSPPRFDQARLNAAVGRMKSMGIAVTVEVPIETSGRLPQPFVEQLKSLRTFLDQNVEKK